MLGKKCGTCGGGLLLLSRTTQLRSAAASGTASVLHPRSEVRSTCAPSSSSFVNCPLINRATYPAGMRRPVASFSLARGSSPVYFSARHYLVRFASTPNDECMKFFVDDDTSPEGFLHGYMESLRAKQLQDAQQHPKEGGCGAASSPVTAAAAAAVTMSFDSTNHFQSPLADAIMSALPVVEEVTIGAQFITVRRMVDEEYEVKLRDALTTEAELASPISGAKSGGGGCSTEKAKQEDGEEEATNEAGSHSGSGNGAITLDEETIQTLLRSGEWPELKLAVSAIITDHLYSGAPHITLNATHPHQDTQPLESDSEIVTSIKELIVTMIRPELQRDGGDIRFIRFAEEDKERILQIELLGACKTCKSSKSTLQDLIERTTKFYIPEVAGIEAFVRKRGVMTSLLTGQPQEV